MRLEITHFIELLRVQAFVEQKSNIPTCSLKHNMGQELYTCKEISLRSLRPHSKQNQVLRQKHQSSHWFWVRVVGLDSGSAAKSWNRFNFWRNAILRHTAVAKPTIGADNRTKYSEVHQTARSFYDVAQSLKQHHRRLHREGEKCKLVADGESLSGWVVAPSWEPETGVRGLSSHIATQPCTDLLWMRPISDGLYVGRSSAETVMMMNLCAITQWC